MRKRPVVHQKQWDDLPATFAVELPDGRRVCADRPSYRVAQASDRCRKRIEQGLAPLDEDLVVVTDWLAVQEEKYPSA